MTTEQFIQRVSKWEGYLQGDFQKDVLLLACKDLAAKIRNRVRETGMTGEGRQHQYSTKDILVGASSFQNKSGFNKALALTKGKKIGKKNSLLRLQNVGAGAHWVTINKGDINYHLIVLPGGYKAIRQIEGLPTFAKNYSRTTEMWTKTGVKKQEKNKVTIGGTTQTAQNKINWNSSRDKDNIIAANQTEIDAMSEFLSVKIKEFINASFGNQ